MSNRKRSARVIICLGAILVAISILGAAFLDLTPAKVDEASHIKLSGEDINTNYTEFLDSNVMYRLPDTVSDGDTVSLIIQTKSLSLLDAYEAKKPSCGFTEFAYSDTAREVKNAARLERSSLLAAIGDGGVSYTEGAEYSAIFSGFEIRIKARDFEAVCAAVGNRGTVIVGDEYLPAETQLVENTVNVYDTGIFNSSSFGYDGSGTLVAVLDTGLDYNHTAFSEDNYTSDDHALTLSEIESLISDTKASALYGGLTASDVYVSQKVPFAFDYADADPDVYPMTPTASDHGTHVAGVIAGKDDVITGVAPNAQLAIMKIFSDEINTSRTAWILSALEDCVVMGVDVVNMSIGTSCGFSRVIDREAVSGVYDRIRSAGISLVVAASNSFNSTYGSEKNGNLGLTSNPDSATVGSPSTYESALSVASISGSKTPYLLYNGSIIYFTESTDRVTEEKHFYDDVLPEGTNEMEIEYVTIPGAGRGADYSGLDVEGKIALVRRGSTTFEEKANVAQAKGAVGIIIYNNVSGDIKMNVGDTTIGVCSISQDNGELLAAEGTGTLKLSRSQTSGPFMSDFSSWGPSPDLGIKPEITAHGGMIYSAVPGQSYDHQSGTSMACPNVAGMTALVRQYVAAKFPEHASDPVKIASLTNQLMMSTADIVYNTNGLPYAVRKQGAGLASLNNIAAATAYAVTYSDGVEMDKTKLELGDDPDKTGVYDMSFAIKNFGDKEISFDVSAYIMTEGVSETKTNQGETTVDELGKLLEGATLTVNEVTGGTKTGMTVTVPAGGSADVSVTVTLSASDKKYLDDSFENGMYVEGFIILDCADESVVDLSIPYLAFYGDWTEAPLFDLDFFATNKDELDDSIDLLDKTLPDAYATRPIGKVENDYVNYLGSYYFVQDPSATKISADRKYISISNQVGAVHELSNVWAGLLRNAAKIVITITDDSTGEVVFERVETDVRKSYGDGGSIYPADVEIGFNAYDENLKNNTSYTVKLQGYVDYGDGGLETNDNNTFEFPLVTDFQAPAVTDCEFYTEYDRTEDKTRLFAKIAVYDNHYSMALQVGYVRYDDADKDGAADSFMLEAFDQYLTPVYSEADSTTYVVYELTDYIDDIKRNAANGNCFTVATYDYALNTATYEITLPDEFDSFYFEEESITLSPNQVHTLTPLAHPGSEWTQLLEYTSTNTNVAHIVNNKLVTVAPGETVIIAKDPKTNRRAMLNVTVLGEDDEGYVRYDKPVTDSFALTGYLTNKAYHFVSTDDRDIGSTGNEMKFSGGHYSLKMYPSESVTLRYRLDAYFPEDTEVVAVSGNDSLVTVESVNGEWVITAVAEGYASVSVDVLMDGQPTYYSQSISIEIKDPYVTTGASLTGYYGLGGKVMIPDSLAVTDIGQFAFSNFDYVLKGEDDVISEEDPTSTKQWFLGNDTITEIVIPEGVKAIGNYAFANLTALEKITLPSTLERIDVGAFYGCSSLATVEGIENVKFINRAAFEGCNLKGKLELDRAVAIMDRAFAFNKNLKTAVLGESVQSVGSYAFYENNALESVDIKAGSIKLGQYAFAFCSSLKAIDINTAVIPTAAFNECTALATVNIGPDVSVIGEYAFSNAPATSFNVDSANVSFKAADGGRYLTDATGTRLLLVAPGISGEFSVTDGKLTAIGNGALSGNANLTSVSIPSVTHVGDYAFYYNENLKEITLGALEYIGDYSFYRTSITTLPSFEKLDRIGNYAFAYTDVTELTVRDGMTVGESAFRECSSLSSIVIGDGVKIGKNAFRLDKETNFASTHGSYRAEDGTLVYYYIYTSPLHSLTIGDGVNIGSGAFWGASELESVLLGDGAVIGNNAFYNAVRLENIDLSGALSIGSSAFSGDVLYEFADSGMNEPVIDDDSEYVYRYYATAIKHADLSSATKIGEDAFAYCSSLESVKLGSAISSISARAFNRCSALREIDLSHIVTVGDNAFAFTALTDADLSAAELVDKYAFVYCASLESVTLRKGDCEIREGAFAYCDKLAEVKNSEYASIIGDYSFAYTAISGIDLSAATSIGDGAFTKETLTPFAVTLGSSLEHLGENPFTYCSLAAFTSTLTEEFNGESFSSVTDTYDVSESVAVIDGMLYLRVNDGLVLVSYAGDATSVSVAQGTVRISANAFAGSPVEHVEIPGDIRSIGHKAFFDCKALKLVSIEALRAPVLEEEYDYHHWLCAENIPATGDYLYTDTSTGDNISYSGLGIVPYFMWNATDSPNVIYYGANFVDYIGHTDRAVALVRPSNGEGYDSFIWSNYFGTVIEGAPVADEITLEAIAAIDSLPDTITLADKDAVVAARAAYDRISSYTQRALVLNLDKLVQAEQRISDLEYIAGDNGNVGDTETETDTEIDTELETESESETEAAPATVKKPVDTKTIVIIALSAASAALVAALIGFIMLYVKAKKGKCSSCTDKKAQTVQSKTADKAKSSNDSVADAKNAKKNANDASADADGDVK